MTQLAPARKLILVSNRLPLSLTEDEGQLGFAPSPGGLASGLRTYLRSAGPAVAEYVWVGWPGRPVPPEQQAEVARRCREEFSARPVFLSREDVEAFYEGICNKTIWPLFHYFPSLVAYEEEGWLAYERVNQIFADEVREVAGPGDLVWVHDYHFFLLPGMLKKQRPDLRVGFFLHVPFPSFELFRLLPDRWRRAMLTGVLGADLIGFHTHDYTQHFLKCVRRILGCDHELGQLALGDRIVCADTFPMGVDFAAFSALSADPALVQSSEEFRRPLGECRAILSIDRLDYTKGIPNRLLAFQAFLEANPDWHGRVALVMVVVPSRTGVEDYQRMKTRVDELVGHINGRFGRLDWTPVLYQYRSYPQEHLVALYVASDVMLVTPLRDGMNLVAKEYVAARADETGVLVLSEMAGAASELGEAVTVNPNDIPGMARGLLTALEMPRAAQRQAMAAMRKRLRRYDVVRWAGDFLDGLRDDEAGLGRSFLGPAVRGRLLDDFRKARRRLLLSDYDGTLAALTGSPEQASPDPELLATLRQLARHCDVVVVSGRPRATLEAWLGELPIDLVAEHGIWVRRRGGEWTCSGSFTDSWKPMVRDMMEHYVDRLPGALIEEKEFTLAWHYRLADPDLAELRSRELIDHLIGLIGTSDLKVVDGSKVVEVRPSGTSKGAAAGPWLSQDYDFVLALGDDTTDEDLFRLLSEPAYSIRIGLKPTHARFRLPHQGQARRLLEELAEATNQWRG